MNRNSKYEKGKEEYFKLHLEVPGGIRPPERAEHCIYSPFFLCAESGSSRDFTLAIFHKVVYNP